MNRSSARMSAAVLVIACGLPLACARAPQAGAAATPVQEPRQLVSGGLQRTYILHLPAGARGPLPLVIALHGFGGSGERFERVTGFSQIADREGFIVAYPDGRFRRWNAGAGFPNAGWWETDDVRFISDLIDVLAHRYPVDRGRVFVTGHSNGGFMAYRLARELAGKVVAAAPLAGSMYQQSYREATREVAILHLHGLADTIIPFGGGDAGPYHFLPADSAVDYWIRKQHCARSPDTVFDSAGIVGRRWKSRSGRGDVVLYTAQGTGHVWWSRARTGVDASELIWRFFREVPPRRR